MNKQEADERKRLFFYSEFKHTPISTAKKYTFYEITSEIKKKKIENLYGKIKISYEKHFPQVCDAVFLNCANADKMNAGYGIDHKVTQEGQLFHDTDLFFYLSRHFLRFHNFI